MFTGQEGLAISPRSMPLKIVVSVSKNMSFFIDVFFTTSSQSSDMLSQYVCMYVCMYVYIYIYCIYINMCTMYN